MNNSSLEVNETLDLHAEFGAMEIDKMQHFHKRFGFWTKDVLNRTVSRERAGLSDVRSTTPTIVESDSANQEKNQVIEFPAIFNTKVIGDVSVNTMQEWECVVDSVHDSIVNCTARSLIGKNSREEFMAIPISEFSPEDQSVVTQGIIFRLIIGFVKKPSGANTRQALTYIRRYLPKNRKPVDELLGFLAGFEHGHARQ